MFVTPLVLRHWTSFDKVSRPIQLQYCKDTTESTHNNCENGIWYVSPVLISMIVGKIDYPITGATSNVKINDKDSASPLGEDVRRAA